MTACIRNFGSGSRSSRYRNGFIRSRSVSGIVQNSALSAGSQLNSEVGEMSISFIHLVRIGLNRSRRVLHSMMDI